MRGGGDVIAVGAWGELARALELLGVEPGSGPELRMMPALVSSTGAVAMAMAFGFFGKRRRDGDPPAPDEVLEAHAANGPAILADATLVPETVPVPVPPTLDEEMLMPRWRRPSLLQARKADPLRAAVEVDPMTFAAGAVTALDGLERRLIRYTVVELLDAPDELLAGVRGTLTQGDEVQLIERSGSHWRVLCPDGREGWIHRMTLGEIVGDPAADPGSHDATDTWTGTRADDAVELDPDQLAALLARRAMS